MAAAAAAALRAACFAALLALLAHHCAASPLSVAVPPSHRRAVLNRALLDAKCRPISDYSTAELAAWLSERGINATKCGKPFLRLCARPLPVGGLLSPLLSCPAHPFQTPSPGAPARVPARAGAPPGRAAPRRSQLSRAPRRRFVSESMDGDALYDLVSVARLPPPSY